MAPAEGVDELFEVKNAFYLGNYQQCIVEAQKCRPSTDEGKLLRDSLVYRSYIAQKKYSIPLEEITGTSPSGLQAVKLFADYMAHERKR